MKYPSYRYREIASILDEGPMDGEDWYRLTIVGNKSTKSLNVNREEVEQIANLLAGN